MFWKSTDHGTSPARITRPTWTRRNRSRLPSDGNGVVVMTATGGVCGLGNTAIMRAWAFVLDELVCRPWLFRFVGLYHHSAGDGATIAPRISLTSAWTLDHKRLCLRLRPREMTTPGQNANDDGKPNSTTCRNHPHLLRLWATFEEEEPSGRSWLC